VWQYRGDGRMDGWTDRWTVGRHGGQSHVYNETEGEKRKIPNGGRRINEIIVKPVDVICKK